MMRAKERGRWEIAANHNVRLPGALTGKRRSETSLDSKATQLLRANEMTRWVKRVGGAVLACRLHLRLRTYRCEATNRRFGRQSDILAIAQMDCKAFAHQNLDAVIFRALWRPLSIVFRNIVGNESNHDHFAKRWPPSPSTG
jgi:hypothetical protein